MSGGGITHAGKKLEQHQKELGLKVTGSNAQKSTQGQFLLDDILTNPGTTHGPVTTGHFKGGTRFVDPARRGATFDANGVFQYFGKY